MKWQLPVVVAACGLGLAACCLVLGQGLHERAERVKREIGEQVAAHALLCGTQAQLPEDNSKCLLCHANFEEEALVTTHLVQGITCAVCHGISHEHMNDETSQTKPDIMFGRAEVQPFCERCHDAHQHPDTVAQFQAQWQGKVRPNGRLILKQAMCTDCHGIHAIVTVPVLTATAPQ